MPPSRQCRCTVRRIPDPGSAAEVRLLRDRIAAVGRELLALQIEGVRCSLPLDIYTVSYEIDGAWRLLDNVLLDLEKAAHNE